MMGLFKRTSELWISSAARSTGAARWMAAMRCMRSRAISMCLACPRSLHRSGDPEQDQLKLTVPLVMELVGLYIPQPTTESVTVQLLWLRKGESTARVARPAPWRA